jgi:hypothetical protein
VYEATPDIASNCGNTDSEQVGAIARGDPDAPQKSVDEFHGWNSQFERPMRHGPNRRHVHEWIGDHQH